jgi:hypothetical protein
LLVKLNVLLFVPVPPTASLKLRPCHAGEKVNNLEISMVYAIGGFWEQVVAGEIWHELVPALKSFGTVGTTKSPGRGLVRG